MDLLGSLSNAFALAEKMCKQVFFLISAAPGPDFATTEAADDGKKFGEQKANDKFCNNLLGCINGICLFQPMLMRADSMALSYIRTFPIF